MTKRLACLVIGVIALLALPGRASAQPPLKITLTDTDTTGGVACIASMSPGDKKPTYHVSSVITWEVDGTNCGVFLPNLVTLEFNPKGKLLMGGQNVKGCMGSGRKCTLVATVSPSPVNAPTKSKHPYIIRFNGDNAGDPEIDIDNTTGDGKGRNPGGR